MTPLSERTRTRLVGCGRPQQLRALRAAAGLFLLVAVLGLVGKIGGWVPEAFVSTTPVAVGVSLGALLIGCVAAGVNAFRNGGLLPSWLLVGAPLSAWLGVYHLDPSRPLSTVAVVAGISLLTVPVAGTGAYAIGRLVRMRTERDAREVATDPVLRILIGPRPKRTGYWGVLAIALLVVAVAGVALGGVPGVVFVPYGAIPGAPLFGVGMTLVWIGLAALPGYRRDGLVASWALVFGPLFGGLVTDVATDQFLNLPLAVDAATTGLLALFPTLLGGTLGFLLGAGLRRLAATDGNDRHVQDASR